MRSNNRNTLIITALAVFLFVCVPVSNAQTGGQRSRSGDRGGDFAGDTGPGGISRRGGGGGDFGPDMGLGGPGSRRGGMSTTSRITSVRDMTEIQINSILQAFKSNPRNSQKAKELEELREKDIDEFYNQLQFNAYFEIAEEIRAERDRVSTLEFLSKYIPEDAEEIKALEKTNYSLYVQRLRSERDKWRQIMDFIERNPVISDEQIHVMVSDRQLELEQIDLLRNFVTADSNTRESILTRIEEIVSARYDNTVKNYEFELQDIMRTLDMIQKRIDAKKEQIESWKDPEFKKQEVDDQVKRLTEPRRGGFNFPRFHGF